MALIVQKFGGSSVKDRDRIFNVARIVANTHNAGNDVVVVVSAQGDTTDDLITKAAEITHNPSAREMDMLLAAGEEISIALLAMALNELGCHATSLTGWQAGFRTDRAYTKARITKLETERISSELERNRVVVVAGFQGLNKLDDITTLGRGGSDTSAVAIAAALHADRCQIFTDVEGVYTADPRKVRNTRKLEEITFDEMLELASLGAQVLNNRSVELADDQKTVARGDAAGLGAYAPHHQPDAAGDADRDQKRDRRFVIDHSCEHRQEHQRGLDAQHAADDLPDHSKIHGFALSMLSLSEYGIIRRFVRFGKPPAPRTCPGI